MWLKLGLGALALYSLFTISTSQDLCGTSGCRLSRHGTYFVTAPREVHPNQEYNVFVTILNMFYQQIHVRVAIKRNNEDVIGATRLFTTEGFAVMPLLVPPNASPGNYTLRLEGQEIEGVAGFIFENETALEFGTKQVSVYVQTNKPLYRQGQKVLFRVFPVEKNLMSRSGSLDVYVRDATGTIVRRWLSQQTNAGGVLDMNFVLSEQPAYGTWSIEVKGWSHTYSKTFLVNEFFVTAIDVNVSMPLFHNIDEFGIGGIIMANLSLGQPAKGTCQVYAEIRIPPGDRDPNKTYEAWPTITKDTRYFPGMTDFLFTLEELEQAWRDFYGDENAVDPLANTEVYVQADVYDWFLHQGAYGGAITVIYDNLVTLKILGDTSRSFKPNQVFAVYFAVQHSDGTPLRYFRRQVTINLSVSNSNGNSRSEETRVLTPDDGIIKFTWWPEANDERVRLTAFYDDIQTRAVTLDAYRHYTQTGQYVSLTTSTTQPSVDKYMVFTVVTTAFVEEIYFLVASAGNIITGGMLFMQSQQKTFSLSVSRDMIPEAHLIVWYLHKGEIVSDSLNFYVNGTRINSAEMSFNRGKDFTGDTVEVTGRTDPSSYLGSSVLDFELWSYGWNSFITEVDIIRELWTFDKYGNKSFYHTWKMPFEQEEMVHYAASSYAVDSNRTFEFAGLLVFSDANVTKRPSQCNETRGSFPCMDGQSCYEISEWCDGVRKCQDGQDEMGCPVYEVQRFTPPKDRLGLLTRHYVMVGEWLWGGYFVMPNGRLDWIVEVPDEPMTWALGGFAISRNLGFGIVHSPPRHQATRAFYMRAEAPYEVKKGEMIGIRLGLFNYWHEDIECLVTLHDSDQYRFVIVEEFGIVSSYAPRTVRGNMQTMIYLRRGRVYELLMPVLPVHDGCLEVTVTAFTFLYTDTEVLELCTEYDGVTNYLHTPYFVDMFSSGSLTLPDLEIPVPERFVIPEERRHLYVPGSPVATVGIVGDVIGPGFFQDFLDAENTIRKPFGSAEQNMYNFAYNLYNLLYLKLTNQQDLSRLRTTLDHMNIALQRQLGYMNQDGSFSMFRDYQQHTPSTWVTAFIMRTLQDANQKDWEIEYFYIPGELLNRMALWLCSQQDSSGAFREQAPLYDRKQWSNYTTVNGNYRRENTSLTAYVLIAFVNVKLTGQAEICKQNVITPARAYLEQRVQNITDPYTMAIVSYALAVSGSNRAADAFYKLQQMRRTNNLIYWAQKDIPPNEIRYEDTFTFYQPRKWFDNEGYAVEATSYALMTYLLNQPNTTEIRPIMEWLQAMRNSFAGQASTQDTITALIALKEYATRDSNRDIYNILFEIQATAMGNKSQAVHIRKGNWATMEYAYVHPVWGSVRGTSNGTGIALMQLETKVNVEYPDQIRPAAQSNYFNISISEIFTGRNASIMQSTICAKWSRPDISEQSGLTVIEAHLPTGYVITNDVLRAYAQSGDVPTLRRAEAYGRKIVFYFDYLSANETTCVSYRTDRWFPVANMTIQHLLRVFDYYEPGMHNTSLYTTRTLTALHMCQVCGSFQCPYCQYYNTAPSSVAPFSLIFIFLATMATAYVSKKLVYT